MPTVRIGILLAWLAHSSAVSGQDIVAQRDLTLPGAVARGTALATVLDTRLIHPQIQAGSRWLAEVTPIKNLLPVHERTWTPRRGAPNSLPLGELTTDRRARPISGFPGIAQTPWTPPDPTIAVGPDHIVQTVNMTIAFYTKDGILTFSQRLDSTGNPGFFEDVGGGEFTFDPKCFYDHQAQRFVVVALEVYGTAESYISIAVSDDSDPHGLWYKYRTDAVTWVSGTSYWVDYPGFGFDDRGYYVTGNLFRLSGPGPRFAGVLFRAIDKTPMLSGDPVSFNDLRDGGAASVQAAQHHDIPPAPYFVGVENTSTIRIHTIDDPFGTPVLQSTSVTVPDFEAPFRGAPNAGGRNLRTLDERIINVHWRNGNLYAGHTVFADARHQARWYHFDTAAWPNSGDVTLIQSGNIDAGPDIHTWFPAIYQNGDGDVGLVVAHSSANLFASIQVTGRKANDPLGMMGALTQIAIGTSGYELDRWGDFFDIAVDPRNDRTFWVVGEIATDPGVWATAIGRFLVSLIPGDLNCDGWLNGADIDPFLLAVGDPDAYEIAFPQCDRLAADTNGDGIVNGADVDPFFALLGGGP